MYATQAPFDQILASIPLKGDVERWIERQRVRFVELLDVDKPKYFLVTTKDRNPVEPLPSDESMKNVPGLVEYLNENYEFVRNFDRFRVYERRELDLKSPVPSG